MAITTLEITESDSIINIEIVENQVGGFGGVKEAPIDGKQYARKDETWEEVDGDQSYSKVSEVDVGGVRVGDTVEPELSASRF